MAGDSHMRNLYHDLRVAIGAVGSSTAANNGSAHAHGENFIAHASSTGTTLQFLWAASTASSYEEMAARAGVQTYLPWQRYIAEYLHNVTRAQVLATSSAKPQGLGDLLVLDYPQWEVLFGAQEFDVATDFAGWEVAAREFRRASPPPKAVVEFSHLQLPPALEASWRKAVARSGAVALRLEAPFRRGTGRQVGHGDQEAKTPDRGWHWGEGPFALMLRGLIMTHVSPSLCPCLARQLGVVVR